MSCSITVSVPTWFIVYRIRLNPGAIMESQGHLRVMGKWPTKPKSQRLERHGTQGEPYLLLPAYWFTMLVIIQIDPHRRHVDKSTVAYFWKTLDTWTAMHKPSLMTAWSDISPVRVCAGWSFAESLVGGSLEVDLETQHLVIQYSVRVGVPGTPELAWQLTPT